VKALAYRIEERVPRRPAAMGKEDSDGTRTPYGGPNNLDEARVGRRC
jgi:hypothetical protein